MLGGRLASGRRLRFDTLIIAEAGGCWKGDIVEKRAELSSHQPWDQSRMAMGRMFPTPSLDFSPLSIRPSLDIICLPL